jgi:hypothetical protein
MAVGFAALRPHQWHCQDGVMRTLLLGRGRGGILSPVPTFIQHNISFHCCLNVKARLVLIMSSQKYYLAPLLKLAVCLRETRLIPALLSLAVVSPKEQLNQFK